MEKLELVPIPEEQEENPVPSTDGTLETGSPVSDKERLDADRIRHLYERASYDYVTQIILAALSGFALWEAVPQHILLGGYGLLGLVTLARMILVSSYQQAHPKPAQAGKWGRRYSSGVLVSAMVWGAAGLLPVLYGNLNQQMLMLFILGCVCLSGYVSMVSSVRTFAAFLFLSCTPVTVWLFMRGDSFHIGIGSMTILACGLLLSSSRSIKAHLDRSNTLASSNAGLIRNLVTTKDQAVRAKRDAEQANKALQGEIRERKRAEARIRQSERERRSVLDNMQDTIFRTDRYGRISWVSPSVKSLLVYNLKELKRKPLRDLFCYGADHKKFLDALSKQDALSNYELQLKRQDGRKIWVSVNVHYHQVNEGEIAGLEGSLRDITQTKIAEHALFEEKERAQVTLSSIGDGVITTDAAGRVEYMNPIAEEFAGWSSSEAQGVPAELVLQLIDENDEEEIHNPVSDCLESGLVSRVSGHPLMISRNQEHRFSVEMTVAPIRNEINEITGTVLVFHDVTELRGLARQMSHQAAHDALTGLINRREFEHRVEQALLHSQQENASHALCYIDLDRFKVVNDTCGHIAGDELLRQLSEELKSNLREADTLARLGGDEFGALLEGCSVDNARSIAETLRTVVEEFRFVWEDKSFRVGASIGLVPITRSSSNITELLSAADSACYVAKDTGRNRVHVFVPDDQALNEHQGQVQWVRKIQDALEQDRFTLILQPIHAIDPENNDRPQWGEILLRMNDDDGELIMPGAFMPAAERYQLMPALEHWVIDRTLRLMNDPQTACGELTLCALNISSQCMFDQRHQKAVLDLISDSDIDPARLCFDISENSIVTNPGVTGRFVRRLSEMGCKIALDDFGSGMMSFSYLKNIPADYLKLDSSFIKNMSEDRLDEAIVSAVHQISKVMNLEIIAECVESQETLNLLRKIGIEYAQGYHVAPTVTALQPIDLKHPPAQVSQG